MDIYYQCNQPLDQNALINRDSYLGEICSSKSNVMDSVLSLDGFLLTSAFKHIPETGNSALLAMFRLTEMSHRTTYSHYEFSSSLLSSVHDRELLMGTKDSPVEAK